jgi:hypothetical protein
VYGFFFYFFFPSWTSTLTDDPATDRSSKLQTLYVEMQERGENSFSRALFASLFPPNKIKTAFLVPGLFDSLLRLPGLAKARKRVDVVCKFRFVCLL